MYINVFWCTENDNLCIMCKTPMQVESSNKIHMNGKVYFNQLYVLSEHPTKMDFRFLTQSR